MIYTFEGVPAWAIAGSSAATCGTLYTGTLYCPHPPDNMADWTNFVTALVARYCPNGVPGIQYYELWNEPYNVYGTNYVQLSPTDLAKMTHAAYGIIRSNCPAAKIMTPDFSTVPGSSTSPLPIPVSPPTRRRTSARLVLSVRTRLISPPFISTQGPRTPRRISCRVAPYTVPRPTASSAPMSPGNLFGTPKDHGARTAPDFLHHPIRRQPSSPAGTSCIWAAGYEQANWYDWDDSEWGTLCTAVPGGTCAPMPVPVAAYDQTYNWLVGKVMYNGCSTAIDGVTWSCQLAAPGGYTGLIVWDTAGNESYTPPSPSLYTQYRDLAGNVTHYSGGAVTVGLKPILFEN